MKNNELLNVLFLEQDLKKYKFKQSVKILNRLENYLKSDYDLSVKNTQ